VTARTIWEQGHEPGRQMVALGLAGALTAVAVDLLVFDQVTVLFDVVFVPLSIALALLVRPRDFFTVGVLPPLMMVVIFLMLGATRPGAIAHPDDSLVQSVISGLSSHSLALVLGYGLSLACLAVRQRFLRVDRSSPRSAPGHLRPGG
jgi:hypothetical protein